ncbi:hypothetical protein [Ensifer sp. 4252]|uniref:hypothetical protein n=1 Tax=Ensifer sp. 4252 TaxID=3373915 RepID=UPI003D2585E2
MKLKRLFAVSAFLVLSSFCAIIAVFVPRIDLAIVMLIGLSLAGYDIWDQLFRRRLPPP